MTAGYPLGPLLSARLFREDAAEQEVRRARERVNAAKSAAAAAREEYARYRAWRPEEEARLFAAIRGRDVTQTELDGHFSDIHALRTEELAREERCVIAEKAVQEAEKEAEKAKSRHLAAIRNRQKIEMHRERWLRGEKIRLEALEESELEDFPYHPAEDDAGDE